MLKTVTDTNESDQKSSSDSERTFPYATNAIIIALLCFFYLIAVAKIEKPKSVAHVSHKDYQPPPNKTANISGHQEPEKGRRSNKTIIVLWTLTWMKQLFFKNELQKEYTCGKYQCIYTANRSKLFESKAVFFTVGHFRQDDLPVHRFPWQRWVAMNHESPLNSRLRNFLSGRINWTVSYHRSADILFPYGYYTRRGSQMSYPYEVGNV